MNFRNHSNLVGAHAFLGASKYTWLNYDEQKLEEAFNRNRQTQLGTELHELASRLINLGVKLPKTKKTLNMFVNDAIDDKMHSEVVLAYSRNCFGTADAIKFDEESLKLDVRDLKTGQHPAKFEQLWIYDAIFCLEYNIDPRYIEIENRIYQNNDVLVDNPVPELIVDIMCKIELFDKRLNQLLQKGE